MAIIEAIYDADLAIIWLAFLLRPVFHFVVAARIPAGLTRSVATVVVVTAISYVLTLPFPTAILFRLETQSGFNRTSPWMFALDQVKAAALQLALACRCSMACSRCCALCRMSGGFSAGGADDYRW